MSAAAHRDLQQAIRAKLEAQAEPSRLAELLAVPNNYPKPTSELCPRCQQGYRLPATFTSDGVLFDDSYCSYCGKNWPTRGTTVAIDTR